MSTYSTARVHNVRISAKHSDKRRRKLEPNLRALENDRSFVSMSDMESDKKYKSEPANFELRSFVKVVDSIVQDLCSLIAVNSLQN